MVMRCRGEPFDPGGSRSPLARPAHLNSRSGDGRMVLQAIAPLLLAPLCGLLLQPPPVQAQYSPLCERNGRRVFCSFTPHDGPGDGEREVAWIVFADHSRVEVIRDERHCSRQGRYRLCQAWIRPHPAVAQPEPALYRGSCVVGGYRHEYRNPVLQLAVTYLFEGRQR